MTKRGFMRYEWREQVGADDGRASWETLSRDGEPRVPTPEQLEIAAHSLTAVLGVWLGLTVLTRSRGPSSRVFAFLSLTLAVWSSSIIVNRLSSSLTAVDVSRSIEEIGAALVVPASAHLSLIVASEGHPSRRRAALMAAGYVLNILFALPGTLTPATPIGLGAAAFALGPVPPAFFYWVWIVVRLATLLTGGVWLVQALLASERDTLRRRQLRALLVTVGAGALGGSIRILPVLGETDPWIGVSLVTLAMVLAGYAVFSAGIFFPSDVAGRAFWATLALGVGVFVLVGGLLAVDTASSRILGLDLPIFTALVLVVAIAIYEPMAAWLRSQVGARSPRTIARERLLRALGQSTLTGHAADAGVQPALTRLTRTLDLAGASVVGRDGTVLASEGVEPSEPSGARAPTISLVSEEELVGELRLGATRSGRPLSERDEELLRLSATYVAAALRTGRLEEQQLEALSELSADRAYVDSTASALHAALVRHTAAPPGLRVFALGPLRVEREDGPINRWGGEKAGTRQAQGLFAFLFDRGERGVAKDEALELIWPDTDLDKADLAFHRTLAGLRHTLDPAGVGKQVIRFYNDRYRLDRGIVEWSDLGAFEARLDEARQATDRPAQLERLADARQLYRGDYLDDCPFYGDSAHVEDRRGALRDRFVDLLIALGEAYEANGDRVSAASAYREALGLAVDGCPPAEAGLARLGLAT